jgi:hypothetical protein
MGVTMRYLAAAAAIVCLAAVTASAGAASAQRARTYSTSGTPPLATALVDPVHFSGGGTARAFAMTHSSGATYARIAAHWASIAPTTRPDGWVPGDPTSAGYSWGGLDAVVNAAVSAGVTPILDIIGTPSWAYARQPKGVNGGTPKATSLGSFAQALATHYNGSGAQPAVHVFEVWNEPDLSLFLDPVSPSAYRGMVNAVADAVHMVDPTNLVVAGGLDPFGHPKSKKQSWYSMSPLAFMRSLLCISKGSHPRSTCSAKVHFDVWSHHPYTFGGPFGKARHADDVELGDLPRMRAVLQAGVRLHHVVSDHSVKFWVTEFGWATNPPRRHAASLSLASRWTAEALYQMWRSGVSLATWFDLQDRRSPSPYQSGLYFHSSSLGSARPKPVRTAFRFPFVAYLKKASVTVWGRDATSEKVRVTIQLKHGKRWRTVAYISSNRYGIFRATLRLNATKQDSLRAVAPGSGKSLAFSLTVPYAPSIGPWG